ncbi:hypothetical protein UPYG_G00189450 [Umbra pygmaea]|uniref:Uncharacterized protein n=1 Tax=Umbra pygmaea TaxID=75934 RepID=A0ABD0XDE4_UMBPY
MKESSHSDSSSPCGKRHTLCSRKGAFSVARQPYSSRCKTQEVIIFNQIEEHFKPAPLRLLAQMSRSTLKSRAEKGHTTSAPPPLTSQSPDLVEIIPGLLTESSWVSMLGQEDGEEVVVEILEEVMSRVMDKCYLVYLQRQLEPFTVSWARDALVQVLEWHFVVQDEGDGPESALTGAEDSEPLLSTPDSWAEGCVIVKWVDPTQGHSPLQSSSPVGGTSREQDHTDSHKPHTDSQLSSSPQPPRDARKPTEPSGVRDFKRAPAPPTIPKRRPSRKTRVQLPATKEARLPSPMRSLSQSLGDEEETCPQSSAKLQAQKHRLDLSRLPGHRVWPQYEVLEISPSKHFPWRPRGSEPQNNQKKLSRYTKAVKPLTSCECPPWTQRRCALTGEVYVSTERSIANNDNSEGIVPFNGSLMLDSMELAPGVTLKSPQGIRFSPLKVCPTEPKHNAKLKPVQNYLAVPQFSLEQVTALSVPQVTPLL